MSRRHALASGAQVMMILLFVASNASPGERWVEVTQSTVGTPPTVESWNSAGDVVIEVDLAGFFVSEHTVGGTDFSLLTVPTCGGKGAVGQPHLPFRTVLVPVPNGLSAGLRVVDSTSMIALTGVTVAPQQAPVPECNLSAPGFFIDEKAYSSDAWFPSMAAQIAQDVVVRGHRFLVVEVAPLAFNPVRNEVKAWEHLTIHVTLSGEIDVAAEVTKAKRQSLHFSTLAELGGAPATDANPTGIEYLIIAHDSLMTAVQPLAEWKRRKGLTVEVVAMSTIGTTSSELKGFLQTRYDSDPDMTYVLLVGDTPMVPVENLGTIFSDLYYSCLDGTDYFPDVVLGRIAVQTPIDCEHVVEKTLAFDRDIVPEVWHGSHLMASYFQVTDECSAERFFLETATHAMHFIRDEVGMSIFTAATSGNLSCNPYFWSGPVSWFPHRPPGYANQSVPQADANLLTSMSVAAQDVIYAFNAGVSLVQYRDHGSVNGWLAPSFWDTDVATLVNGTMTPVVFSITCLTGAFHASGDSLAESLLKKYPGGAVGVIASTSNSFSGYNDLLVHGCFDSFWDDYDTVDGGNIYPHSFRPAEAYLYAKYYMYNWEGAGATTQREFELFHWHGDPELRAFTAVPTMAGVSMDPTIDVGTSTLTVDVDVEGALVAVTDNGALLGRAVVAGGIAVVALDPVPQIAQTLDVVVTGHNLVPTQRTIEVVDQLPDLIFSDGFEDGGTGAWSGTAAPL